MVFFSPHPILVRWGRVVWHCAVLSSGLHLTFFGQSGGGGRCEFYSLLIYWKKLGYERVVMGCKFVFFTAGIFDSGPFFFMRGSADAGIDPRCKRN